MKFLYSKAIIICASVLSPVLAISQTSSNGSNYSTAIPTAVPFLNITPDSRTPITGTLLSLPILKIMIMFLYHTAHGCASWCRILVYPI
jgi:hypothetical protein